MIPRLHKRGRSFKGACTYILHDPGKRTTERVLWVGTQNLAADPDNAWFEMFAVARDQAQLKAGAGMDARGRKNTSPVLHLSLTWAIGENPFPQHMREAALGSLKALGLDQHQSLMAAHGDKEHLHVHIVVNTMHPQTGMTAALKFTKERLSRWAEAYEKQHGIHCQERIENNAERDRLARARDGAAVLMVGNVHAAPQRPPYVPVRHRGPGRREWFTRKELQARMSQLRPEMNLEHKAVRGSLAERHQATRTAMDRNTRAAEQNAREHIKDQLRPQWRDLYRLQKREMKNVGGATLLERAVFVFANRQRLGMRSALSMRQMISLIRHPGKLLDRIEAVHERERRSLAQVEKAQARVLTDRIWEQHRERMDRLIVEQAQECQAIRTEHHARTRGVSLSMAKASLVAEQQVPANDASNAAEDIKRQMAAWRERNAGRDFGREM